MPLNILSFFAIGFVAIYLGCRGFSARGLPLTKNKNIRGTPAKVIGVACLLLGVFIIALAAWFSRGMFR